MNNLGDLYNKILNDFPAMKLPFSEIMARTTDAVMKDLQESYHLAMSKRILPFTIKSIEGEVGNEIANNYNFLPKIK